MTFVSYKENLPSCIEIRELMQKQIQVGSIGNFEQELLEVYLKKHRLMHFFLYTLEAMRYDYGKPSRDYRKERHEAWLKYPKILDDN